MIPIENFHSKMQNFSFESLTDIYLADAYLFEECKRYDVRGKDYFDYPNKYYYNDLLKPLSATVRLCERESGNIPAGRNQDFVQIDEVSCLVTEIEFACRHRAVILPGDSSIQLLIYIQGNIKSE